MIPRVEIYLDSVKEEDLHCFSADDCEGLRDLLMCPHGTPVDALHKHAVSSLAITPAQIKWLKEDLDGWALVEHDAKEGFFFWFTNADDAAAFEYAFE